MDRRLINYLPPVLQQVQEFQAINAANEPEISIAWDALAAVMANQFLDAADEWGVAVWERELRILPKGTDTMEFRKARIKSMWNTQLPYTLPQLRNILQALCGAGNYSADIAAGSYHLVVKIGLAAKSNYRDVQSLLQQVIPANLTLELAQMYNTHAELGRLTHAQLAAYTHDNMRNEVLENGG